MLEETDGGLLLFMLLCLIGMAHYTTETQKQETYQHIYIIVTSLIIDNNAVVGFLSVTE